MRINQTLAALTAAILLTGCAAPITLEISLDQCEKASRLKKRYESYGKRDWARHDSLVVNYWIYDPDNEYFGSDSRNLLDEVVVPFSANGLWQALVLKDLMYTAMPLGGEYLLDRQSYGSYPLPQVRMLSENMAEVNTAVQNRKGAYYITYQAVWSDGKVEFTPIKSKPLKNKKYSLLYITI